MTHGVAPAPAARADGASRARQPLDVVEAAILVDAIKFKDGGTVAPDLGWAQAVLQSHYGISADLSELPGEYDLNFAVEQSGIRTHVLKVMRADCEYGLVDLQCQALEWVRRVDPSVPVASVARTLGGDAIAKAPTSQGEERLVWLITALPGTLYAEVRPQTPSLAGQVGEALARLGRALESFSHPSLVRPSKWDLKAAGWILEHPQAIPDPTRRALITRIGQRFVGHLKDRIEALTHYPIHNDLNDYNLLIEGQTPDDFRVSGMLDFGDMMPGPRVCDIAIGAAYAILEQDRPVEILAAFVAGYHRAWPLSEAELALVFPLLLTRLAVSVTNSGLGKLARPHDAYVTVSERGAWNFLDDSDRYPEEWVLVQLRQACGLPGHPAGAAVDRFLADRSTLLHPILAVDLRGAAVLDISIGGSASPDDPNRFEMASLDRHVQRALSQAPAALGRYAEPRLIYTEPAFARHLATGPVRRTVHVGLDVFMAAGTAVHAPLEALVVDVSYRAEPLDYGGVVTLEHRTNDGTPFYTLYGHLARSVTQTLKAGQSLAKGAAFAHIGTPADNGAWPPHLHLQLGLTTLGRGSDWPGVADADDLDSWLALYPNPARLLGLDEATVDGRPRPDAERRAERKARFARNLKLSYARPLTAVRGWKHFLYDQWGREYLDCYNNVPQVGHCHPRLVRVLAEQARLLNTNSRYLQEAHLEYGHALAARFPAPLEVVFLVNSGSEANELALRLARACTGQRDTLVLEDGYHGNTNAAIAISHYKFAGPGGTGPEPWVHVAPLPDGYRGRYRTGDLGTLYADTVKERLAHIAASGRRPAAFICETYPSVGGQIVLPPGYLSQVYTAVRAAGGVCIADEVQTGFGRLGQHFWGYQSQGVVPDIVVLGKPIGNGHPIGAVVTTRRIAEAFANGMEFFSTFGGSTSACAVGLEVLRIVDDEAIPERAARVGAALRMELETLAQDHPLIGDIRGSGLFMGVELVKDRAARTPATDETAYLVERLRDHRVLIGTEGRDNNVLKIRPPLSFDAGAAERFVTCLRRVLRERPLQA